MQINYNREYFCGCCGREHPGRDEHFCDDCLKHVLPASRTRYAWQRTYYAQHRKDCPYQEPELALTGLQVYDPKAIGSDDRSVQVEINTGRRMGGQPEPPGTVTL